jgi:Mor family transcriptional regulator
MSDPIAPGTADDADIVREILRLVTLAVPELGPDLVRRVEIDVREQFGGRRWFVAKGKQRRLNSDERKQFVIDAVSNLRDEELQQRYGVSRATLYRHMKRRPPP